MTFGDWVRESKHRFRTQPAPEAATTSAKKFGRGVVRRTVDPRLGRSIWDRGDWDILLVLDAARVDMFREAVAEYPELPGPEGVDAVWSNASCSIDWINRTFNDHPDEAARTGYVTANPFADHNDREANSADLDEGTVGHFRPLYRTDWQTVEGGIETVPPEAVTDNAIDAWRRRDELGIDRLVVHYMQPHEPFRARPEWGNGDHKLLANLIDEERTAGSSVFPRVESGDIPMEEFRDVYLDNHHWVLEDITARLLGNVDGRVVLTADHGNGLGEWGSWHHPPAAVAPGVRRVPWAIVESDDAGTVRPSLGETAEVDAETADQLEALGYT